MNRREFLISAISVISALIGVLTAIFYDEEPSESRGGETVAPRNM